MLANPENPKRHILISFFLKNINQENSKARIKIKIKQSENKNKDTNGLTVRYEVFKCMNN
jgi:hypothetical protein